MLPHVCNWVASFCIILHKVLSNSPWYITPPNVAQNIVSMFCTKLEKATLGYVRHFLSHYLLNLTSSYCEVGLLCGRFCTSKYCLQHIKFCFVFSGAMLFFITNISFSYSIAVWIIHVGSKRKSGSKKHKHSSHSDLRTDVCTTSYHPNSYSVLVIFNSYSNTVIVEKIANPISMYAYVPVYIILPHEILFGYF